MQHVSISSIEWRLTDATRSSLASQSRREAVKDAVVKAKDYAAVLVRGKPEAVEVMDGSGHFDGYVPGHPVEFYCYCQVHCGLRNTAFSMHCQKSLDVLASLTLFRNVCEGV
jgi:hypothetical protein